MRAATYQGTAMELHSINVDQGLYVMKCGSGFSCYGFAVLDRKARAVAAWLSREMDVPHNYYAWLRVAHFGDNLPAPGTAEHFAACDGMLKQGADFARATGKRCDAELVPALRGLEGRRVEATVYGERVRFNVGKSSGWMPGHLQIHNARSHGGMMLSADSVTDVRVIR